MRPYFVSHGHPADSGTILVFAESRGKARRLGTDKWPGIGACFTEMRVRRADDEYMALAESDDPHVVDSHGPGILTWGEALEHKREELTTA